MEICQNKRKGDCPNRAMAGKKYCNACDIIIGTSTETGRLRAYKLTKWQSRLDEMCEVGISKSLVEEIGIAKMTLEAIYNQCKDINEVTMNSHRIGDMVTRIEKLINSCHRIEKSSGLLLDKSSVLQIAGNIIGIIQRHVKDPVLIETIANEIIVEISKVENNEDD